MARIYRRKEVEKLLLALDGNAGAGAVAAAAPLAELHAGCGHFGGYTAFRERCDDFDTLAILIEHRLRNLASGRADDLERAFDELKIFMLTATSRTSLHFLGMLTRCDALPLGSHDIFLRELRHLHAMQAKLSGSDLGARLGPGAAADIDAAEAMLTRILERAPALLDLGVRGAALDGAA